MKAPDTNLYYLPLRYVSHPKDLYPIFQPIPQWKSSGNIRRRR